MKTYQGKMLSQSEKPVAIIVSDFNTAITEPLVTGAITQLQQQGLTEDEMVVIHVPGALEIPAVAQKLVDSERFSGLICLGAVIQGETDHYQVVVNQTVSQIANLARVSPIPVVNGVLTTNTFDQAVQRSGGKAGNKGFEVAGSLLLMRSLYEQLAML